MLGLHFSYLPRDAMHISAAYVVMRCLSVCLSVCVSVTFVDHVKTNKEAARSFVSVSIS